MQPFLLFYKTNIMIDTTKIYHIFQATCNAFLSTQEGIRLKNKRPTKIGLMRLHKNASFDDIILNVISGKKSFSVKKSELLDNSFFDTYKAFEKEYLALKTIVDNKLHELFKANLAQKAIVNKEIAENNMAYKNAICAEISGCNADIKSNHYDTIYDIQRKALYPIFEKCALASIKGMRNVDVMNVYNKTVRVNSFLPEIKPRGEGLYDISIWLFVQNGKIAVNTLGFFDYYANPFFIEYKAALDKSGLIMEKFINTYHSKLLQKKEIDKIYHLDASLINTNFQTEIRELLYNKYPTLWNSQAI